MVLGTQQFALAKNHAQWVMKNVALLWLAALLFGVAFFEYCVTSVLFSKKRAKNRFEMKKST